MHKTGLHSKNNENYILCFENSMHYAVRTQSAFLSRKRRIFFRVSKFLCNFEDYEIIRV